MTLAPMVEVIPIDRIQILNARVRHRKTHQQIVTSIERVGLKRPIKVKRQADDGGQPTYGLICGQGRIEAFQMLGETHIPAIVVEATANQCLIESLVENVARRPHRGIDLMREVGALKARGYNDIQIAAKIGMTPSWVNMITHLLSAGEERLVSAVETGLLPLSVAMQIARTDDEGAQIALADAYAQGLIKGAKVAVLRSIVSRRSRKVGDSGMGRPTGRKFTADDLMKLYEQETERQQGLIRKADYAQERVGVVVAALRDLLAQDEFQRLLEGEGLSTMPKVLADRVVCGS